MASLPSQLIDMPSFEAKDWKGYFRKTDPTVLPFNVLTFPSINCTIPDVDKIVPDKGKTLLGSQYTENSGIIGNKEKFSNLAGNEMEVRVWRSIDTPAKKDVIQVFYNNDWLQITENANPLPLGVHRYSFDDYWDSNLNPAESKNLSRLVWVNGYVNPSTKKGEIYSWTGGIAEIVSHTGTTLTINSTTTWRSLGFTENASGNAYVVVNGISHQLVDPTDLDTSTIEIASTAGISDGDIATSRIEVDEAPIPFDMCCENKGYMFYGNWQYQKLYMSNAFNHPATAIVTASQAFQNDLIIPDTSAFTGTGMHTYKITIDSVPVNEQTFVSNGGVNSGSFQTTGYSASGKHTYILSVVGDLEMTPVGASVSGTFTHGQIFEGATSGCRAQLVAFVGGSVVGGAQFKLLTPGVYPSFGETFNDVTNAANTFDLLDNALVYASAVLFKDGIQQTSIPGLFDGVIQMALPGSYTLVDGLTFELSANGVGGNITGDYYQLVISSNEYDTFSWQFDGGAATTGVTITGGDQTLSQGVKIKFTNQKGHNLGDTWTITVNQKITRSWADFYYTIDVSDGNSLRKPGEGYIFQLPSNYWTMSTQEEQIYLNTSYGQWVIVQTQLSGDLRTEAIGITPLKQASSNKVIDPWMVGHMENDLVYVTVDKNLDYIGRLQFLQLPQVDNLSDPVKNDFLECSFVGGGIKYIGKRLYITSPEQGIMLCYDNMKEYWQPPKVFPEMAIPSIISNTLIVHSNVRNQTFTMFTGASDNGSAYPVRVRTPYTDLGNRWKSKNTNASFTEGYIQGNPVLTHRLYLGVEGCGGIFPHPVEPPNICVKPDRAPFGQGSFGSHPNGSDVFSQGSYFQEIFKGYAPMGQYYLIAFEIECISKNHTWALLSLGANAIWSNTGNNTLVNAKNVVK